MFGEEDEGGGEFGEGGARGVFGGRGDERGLDLGEGGELGFEEAGAVVEAAALLEEGVEFVLEGFEAGVGRDFQEDLARTHVEDRGGGGAAAGDLEGLVDEGGGETGEGEFVHAGGELGGGGAGDDGAVEIDGGGAEAGIDGRGAERDDREEERREDGERAEGFHAEDFFDN